MANTLLTISMITREALRVLENNLKFTRYVRRDYDNKFGIEGAKIGTSLNIRKPPRYEGTTGPALAVEDATESQVVLTLDTQFHVDIEFTSVELALSIDDFSDRFLKPAVAAISNKMDFDGMNQFQNVYNTNEGTPGTAPATLLLYLQAGQKLDEEATPMDGMRSIVINPAMQVAIVDALKGLFQAATQIASQYKSGRMGTAIGFEWTMDQNVRSHTVGPLGGTPLTMGAGQTGNSLVTDGWTAAAAQRLAKGDVITIAGVNAVNPQNRQDTGSLRQFVVTSDVSSDGAGVATIPVSPAMTPTGQFQTIASAITDGAAILIFGHASSHANVVTPQGLAFHRDAFVMGTADLPMPRGVDMAARVADSQLGVSLRMVRAYDINQDTFPVRIDVLYGWQTLYAELAARIIS